MLSRSLAAAALAATLSAPSAHAQAAAVPLELARALLASPSATVHAPEIVVGRAPTGFPAELLPTGGRVLGGFRRDTLAVVVAAAMPQAPAAAGEAAQQALRGAGWTFPGAAEVRGFVGPNSTLWRYLCRGGEMVSLTSSAAPEGGSYLRVEYTTRDRPTRCSSRVPEASRVGPWHDVPLPTLNVPPGAVIVSSGTGMLHSIPGLRGAEIHATMRTADGASELLSGFAAELRRGGWVAAPATGAGEAAAQTFQLRAADGKEWFGALTAVAFPGSDVRRVNFQVAQLPVPAQ
ncbi:MAG TPA: hypothetical protein VEX86_23615 [Longimicrobium sp.]|nr:hypothetical protein [Longimicrobium sp.]